MVVPSGNFRCGAGHIDLLVEGKRQDVRCLNFAEHLLETYAFLCLNGTVKMSHSASLSVGLYLSITYRIALRRQFVTRKKHSSRSCPANAHRTMDAEL